MIKLREKNALDAYFKLLKNKGANADNLKRRQHCLSLLLPSIENIHEDGLLYRAAVDQALPLVPTQDWALFLTVVREYFHFWVEDFKTIAAMYSDREFNPDIADLKPLSGDLQGLWKSIEHEKFSTVELWPINNYVLTLKDHGASAPMIETRIKLVKLLIVQLRQAPQLNNQYYRLAVDSIMHLFTVSQMRNFFLTVVREFFSFWLGDPEAASHVSVIVSKDLVE